MFVRWLAPALAAGALILFLVAPDSNGPLLVLLWASALLGYRYAVGLMRSSAERVAVDAIVLAACLVLAFEGGWFLVPAVLAYLDLDRRSPSASSGWPPRAYTLFAGAASGWGWAVLAAVVSGRLDAGDSTASLGSVASSLFGGTAAELAQAGLSDGNFQIVAIIASLFLGSILIGSPQGWFVGRLDRDERCRWRLARTVVPIAYVAWSV